MPNPWVFGYGSLIWKPGFAFTATISTPQRRQSRAHWNGLFKKAAARAEHAQADSRERRKFSPSLSGAHRAAASD